MAALLTACGLGILLVAGTGGVPLWIDIGGVAMVVGAFALLQHTVRATQDRLDAQPLQSVRTNGESSPVASARSGVQKQLGATVESTIDGSEARFRELADAMPQIVYACDADARVDFVNQKWMDYTGQHGAQTADLGAVVHPDDLNGLVRAWKFARDTGTELQAEFRIRRASDGVYRWFLTRSVPFRDEHGAITKWFGTSTDIHDQKRTEAQLVESEARYRAIGESMDFGVWMCDANGRNTYASDSFLQMVGMTQEECSNFGWGDALPPEERAATIAAWQECVRTEGTWDRVHRFAGTDGREYSVLARGVPLRGSAGDVLGWAGINLDITRLVETEKEVGRLAAESDRQTRFYETVLASTPDFVYVFSLEHKVLYANDALIAMWGRGVEGAIGKTFLEIGYEPWHAAMHDREIDEVRATRKPIRGEVPFTGANGRRQYDYIFVPIVGADGEVEAVAGTTRDITDRRQAEELLRASEERQSFLVTLTDTIRPLSDPVAVQAEASRVLCEELGANRVAYFELGDGSFVVERDHHQGVPTLAGRFPVGDFGPDLLSHLHTGHTVGVPDVNANPALTAKERDAFAAIQIRAHIGVPLIKDGALVAGLAVHSVHPRVWTPTEVAIVEETAERTWAAVERVRAESAMRASEELFRTLFATMDEGFCVIDVKFDEQGRATDSRIEVTNRAFDKQTGMTQLVGRSLREIMPTLEYDWFDTYGAVARTGEPIRLAQQVDAMDGRWFDLSVFRLGGAGSRRVAVLFNDITDRKLAEAEHERLVRQLRDLDRRKDEFLATLAHELRNPLAPLRNGLEVIRIANANGTVEQARAMMERQLGHMIRLVDDLLDVGRVTTGKLELRREPVELHTVVSAALETSRPAIEQAGHELDVLVPDESLVVDGDPVRLAQVVSNLLTNSAKYTRRGGHIRLAVRKDGESVVLSVADDGIGIPTLMLEEVFELFTQVDRTLEKSTGGLGIGLSLVKGLVEMHGGTITAHSDGDARGSEFRVRLPLSSRVDRASMANGAPSSDRVRAASRRVLVIDDNVDAADSLAQLLVMLGHQVRTAYDGETGMEIATDFRPDLVLCDIGMPKVSGYEAARRIRAQSWAHNTLLVAVTGWGQEDDRLQSAHAGFDHHLVKPVDAAELLALLSDVHIAKPS